MRIKSFTNGLVVNNEGHRRTRLRRFAAVAGLVCLLASITGSVQAQSDAWKVWHTIRSADGGWLRFGDVTGQAGQPGLFLDIGSAGNTATGELHVVGVTTDGGMWHTIRRADGTWFPFGDVRLAAQTQAFFVAVECSLIGNSLHVVGVSLDGRVFHTIRAPDGNWLPFGDVKGVAGDPGHFYDVGVAGNTATGELHVVGVTTDGGMWHIIRRADGTWFRFGDVRVAAQTQASFATVECSLIGDSLHLAGVSSDGGMFHTIRYPDGNWQPFGDVKGIAGNPGFFYDVGVAGNTATGELHVVGVTDAGLLWHTIRRPDGTWFTFSDVGAVTGGFPGLASSTSVALIGDNLNLLATNFLLF